MRAQRGQGDGTCTNPDEKEDVCRAGEEGEREERMTTSEFLKCGLATTCSRVSVPQALCTHPQWHLFLPVFPESGYRSHLPARGTWGEDHIVPSRA